MNDRALPKAILVPTVLIFVVLAVLLYRWSNQISESTSVRLADSLQMSMSNWQLNFFRDVSDVAGALRVDSENSGNLEIYARRFKEWAAAARYREIARNLYVVRTEGPEPGALRLDTSTYTFKPHDLSAGLTPLIEALSKPLPPVKPGDGFYPRGLAGWRFDPTIPAIARPIDAGQGAWLVVEMDHAVIEQKVLPELSRRYFTGTDGLDFMLAVIAGKAPGHVLYTTDPGFGSGDVPDADGRMDIFGSVVARDFGSPLHVFREVSGENLPNRQWFPPLDAAAYDDGWHLVVRHRRGGALGSFVSDMHRRDLAISFGALFLLASLVAMLIVTTLRANRLAKLQMDFVTTVSHELRSPLAIIRSAAENITQGVVSGDEQMVRYGKAIESQTKRLSRHVEGVLLFAATREGRHRYQSVPLDVAEIVESALSGTSDLIDAAHFTIERRIQADLPRVRGDQAAFSQCLENLIINALKYGAPGRWIGVSADVQINASGAAEVLIRVADRGPGIEPHDLPHLFEPFYRSESATSAQIHGTGLGLSLAKSITDAMQGRITVEGRPGHGAVFTLQVPALKDSLASERI